ncbi:pyridoxal-dependent decarboxylase [Planktotalea sp.]|uniref:pyridoxal phosphate-dependent decarboxylase family protein n=1 Tax=Planktotalea sp. TaxID=2029877 RepID=UPI003298CD70
MAKNPKDLWDAVTLDPDDWDSYSATVHQMLDDAISKMRNAQDGRVWTPFPEEKKAEQDQPLPNAGKSLETIQTQVSELLPYNVGNTHPRFFGWVHGAGSPGNMVADIAAAAMNANLGGRDHGAIYIEKQVIAWVRNMFDFPEAASGLIVSGTSMATIIAMKTARDAAINHNVRRDGIGQARLVGYASSQTHSCVARAFDMLGFGSAALRKIAVNDQFEMDLDALNAAIDADRAAGLLPFTVVGNAGTVNVGAIDDLNALADVAEVENLWLHIDGAFGAAGILSEEIAPRLQGIERANSIAFDFHKWLHVNYDAGFVLIRDGAAHLNAFSERPDYLIGAKEGLAAGGHWPVDYGPELSRGFRALKIWEQLSEHGTFKLGQMISKNCRQAAYLGRRVAEHSDLELLAPVASSVCCLRFTAPDLSAEEIDAFNDRLVIELQLRGIAVPSVTKIDGKTAIRVNITNHRTQMKDIDVLIEEIETVAKAMLSV